MKVETVAILSTGEMGHSVAAVLTNHGMKVVTCLAGRSERTVKLAAKAGVFDLPTMEEVVVSADIVISIVVPSAAKPLAQTVAKAIAEKGKPLLYVDANAISAMTAVAIEGIIVKAGGRFVDACIIGGASAVTKDIPPFVTASGSYAKLYGLNLVGLKRRGFSDETIQALRTAYRIVFRSSMLLSAAIQKCEQEVDDLPEVRQFLDFLRTSERGICR